MMRPLLLTWVPRCNAETSPGQWPGKGRVPRAKLILRNTEHSSGQKKWHVSTETLAPPMIPWEGPQATDTITGPGKPPSLTPNFLLI